MKKTVMSKVMKQPNPTVLPLTNLLIVLKEPNSLVKVVYLIKMKILMKIMILLKLKNKKN